MTTINTSGFSQNAYRVMGSNLLKTEGALKAETIKVSPTGKEAIEDISGNLEEIKRDAAELQRLASIITDRKLCFNVNEQLGCVVIKIVDQNTDKVIREIPSEDMQKVRMGIRKAIGIIFDEYA